ncbi:MAG TPA: hypothetical protein VGH81_07350 [Rudaea sp.]
MKTKPVYSSHRQLKPRVRSMSVARARCAGLRRRLRALVIRCSGRVAEIAAAGRRVGQYRAMSRRKFLPRSSHAENLPEKVRDMEIPDSGDVRTPAGFRALYAMSPYAHIEDGVKYPAVIVYAGARSRRMGTGQVRCTPAGPDHQRQAAAAARGLRRLPYRLRRHARAQKDRNTADMLAFAVRQTGIPAALASTWEKPHASFDT